MRWWHALVLLGLVACSDDSGSSGDGPPADATTADSGVPGDDVSGAPEDVTGSDASAHDVAADLAPDTPPDLAADVEADIDLDSGPADLPPDATEIDEIHAGPTCGDGLQEGDEQCDDGNANEYDACLSTCRTGPNLPGPGPGDLVISELMIDPVAATDPLGEWIELLNVSGKELNLGGCTLSDGVTDHVALATQTNGLLLVPAAERLVLGASTDPEENGGAEVDVAYTSMLLANVADRVILRCNGALVDEVAWDAEFFPVVPGAAMALDPASTGTATNDPPTAWCSAATVYGDGDYGTPGSLNAACPPRPKVSLCVLVANATATLGFVDRPFPVGVALSSPGTTDVSPGVDPFPHLTVEVGAGPDGSLPGPEWLWAAAAPLAGWSEAAGTDGYGASLSVGAPGTLDVAARVSVDNGWSWTLCDTGAGSGDGYSPATAGALEIVADPCAGSPCGAAPPPTCTDSLTAAKPYQVCEPVAADAVACELADQLIDCGATGQLCQSGACGGAVAKPTLAGHAIFSELMTRSGVVPDALGEWLEIRNARGLPLNLEGCVLAVGAQSHAISGPVVIKPLSYAVLGREPDPGVNGGNPMAYGYGAALLLPNGTGSVRLTCAGLLIDEVVYKAAWPAGFTGVAMQLSPYELEASRNDKGSSWCLASTAFGAGDLGTPGGPNTLCPGDEVPVEACAVVAPGATTVPAGAQLELMVTVTVASITGHSPLTDPDPALRVRVAYGPPGEAPSSSWPSLPIGPDATWNALSASAPLAQDRYVGSVRAPAPGSWAIAALVTADGGHTQTACDLDPSTPGFHPELALVLESVPSPCWPPPCENPPGLFCDGTTVAVPTGAGLCTVSPPAGHSCTWVGSAVKDCSELGAYCAGGGCAGLPTAPGPGRVVFSELLIAPEEGPLHEWFELTNGSASFVRLDGCQVSGAAAGSWTISAPDGAPVIVAPGGALVVGRTDAVTQADLVGGLALFETGDTLTLSCAGTLVDTLAWSGDGWIVPFGAPLSLSGSRIAAADNDEPHHWCVALAGGTPGGPNPLCPPLDGSIDLCRVADPATAAADAGSPGTFAVDVFDGGTTDATSGVDAAPGLVVQVGFGPAGSTPTTADWTWFPAGPAPDWTDAGAPGVDRWSGEISTTEPGSYAVGGRASADGGASWTTCDRDGSGNGFHAQQSGTLAVAATPCYPNPCQSPPPLVCERNWLTSSDGPGICVATHDGPQCSYAPRSVNCAPFGGCTAAACVDVVAVPAEAESLVISEIMADGAGPEPDADEWIEVYNPNPDPVELRGCLIGDDESEGHLIADDLPIIVPSGGYAVLASASSPADADYRWPSDAVRLSNQIDEVVIRCSGVIVDRVAWTLGWPLDEGASMSLTPLALSAGGNDGPQVWCPAVNPYGGEGEGGGLGTPGGPNPYCP